MKIKFSSFINKRSLNLVSISFFLLPRKKLHYIFFFQNLSASSLNCLCSLYLINMSTKYHPGCKPSIRYEILMQLLFYLIITFDIICNNNNNNNAFVYVYDKLLTKPFVLTNDHHNQRPILWLDRTMLF